VAFTARCCFADRLDPFFRLALTMLENGNLTETRRNFWSLVGHDVSENWVNF
tara:strand:- start:1549 stop:1704 length:156 start_codon:yes stop_codon:yes gene_type:complete